MKTKALVRFLNRAARFDADVEFVDVVALASDAGDLNPLTTKALFRHVTARKHPRLASQAVSAHNRTLVVTHLKSTVHAAFIKDIYEDMASYFSAILKAAAHNGLDPARLIGDHKFNVDANDILKCGSWDKIVELVAHSLFRRLEDERSTMKLLEKIDNKLGLRVTQQFITDALPYLEIRHLLVHSDGIPDPDFVRRYPTMGLDAGKRMELTHDLVARTRKTVVALVNHYDERIVAERILGSRDLQP